MAATPQSRERGPWEGPGAAVLDAPSSSPAQDHSPGKQRPPASPPLHVEGATRNAQPRVQVCLQSPVDGHCASVSKLLPSGTAARVQGDEALSASEQRPPQGRCPTDDAQDEDGDKDGDDGVRLEEGMEARKAIQISQKLEGEEKG